MEIGSMKRNAFTLVEILIVVVILAILAAVVVPMFTDASSDAMESSLRGNLKTMRSQVELYRAQHKNEYPATLAALTLATDIDGTNPVPAGAKEFGPYLRVIPTNPFTNTNDVGAAGAGTAWAYTAATGAIIANDGEDGPDGTAHSAY